MNNLATVTDRLLTGKWLLKPSVHSQLLKQVQTYTANPITHAATNNTAPSDYIPGDANSAAHAVIMLHGIISKNVSCEAASLLGFTDIDDFTNALNHCVNDDTVKDIVICISSPGGEVTGVEEAARKILAADKIKPVYVWCENQMDSAAYWLGSQARAIGVTPSAQAGGIGVYMLLLDETEHLKAEGIKVEAISSGKYKLLGHEFRSLTDEERQILQDDVEAQHTKFKDTILAKRPHIEPSDMEGLSYNGTAALNKHLADVVCDDLDAFLTYIETNQDMYTENMKPTVNKITINEATTANNNTTSNAATVEIKQQATAEIKENKLTAFFSKLKELMGSYDGEYAAVQGVPGTEQTPTNYTQHAEPDGDETPDGDKDNDNDGDEYEQCPSCSGHGKIKKENKAEDTSDTVAAEPMPSQEKSGNYDAGYAEKQATAPTLPSLDEFRKLCNMSATTIPKGQTEWHSACAEVFTGKLFETKD